MKVTHTYDHFYLYDEITAILKGYAEAHPDLVRLSSLCTTPEGREQWLIEITDPSTGSFDSKPGYFVDGNIHAGEVTGSMCAMYFLDAILSNLDDPEIAGILKRTTIYCVPRITPDGAECYLTTPNQLRSVNRLYPYAEELPGLQPMDLDGDGEIRRMRIKSPYGIWKESETDPRVMVKRRPDELEGDFYNIFVEGIITDFDGINIPATNRWGNDFNRNFPFAWQPEHMQRGAGRVALDNPETFSMAKMMRDHANICCIINMHTMSGMYLYPPGYKSGKEADPADMRRYREVGRMATEETTYPALNVRDEYCSTDAGAIYGLFDDFNHFAQGVMNYTIECWDLNPRCGIEEHVPPTRPDDTEQAERQHKYMRFIDEHLGGVGCQPWTKFDHPQLGEVEIGGIDYKHVVQNCPIPFLPQEVEKHTRFMLRQLKTLPRLSFRSVDVEKVDHSTYRVEARVMNSAYLPSYVTSEALKTGIVTDLKVTLSGDVKFITGKRVERIGQLEGFSGITGTASAFGITTVIPNPCEKKVVWTLQAEPGTEITLSVSGVKTGMTSTSVTL